MLRITFINDGTGWEGLIKLFDDIISDDGTQKVNTRGENKA